MLIMKLFTLFFCLSFTCLVQAQVGTGEWRIHSENRNAKDLAHLNNSVYAAFEAALLEYDSESNEVSSLDVTTGLSDIELEKLAVHEGTNSLFIGYKNGNIDQLKNGNIINIPGIKLASILGSKEINAIVSHGDYVYFATGFGIVKVNPQKSEISETYYPGGSSIGIVDVDFYGDSIYALSKTKLYVSNVNNPALADSAQWSIQEHLPVLNDPLFEYVNVGFWKDSLYFLKNYTQWGDDSVFVIRNNTLQQVVELGNYGQMNSLDVIDNRLVLNGENYHLEFVSTYEDRILVQEYNYGESINPNSVTFFNGKTWYADRNKGLVKWNELFNCERILFKGPSRNQFFAMDWQDGVLAVVPGALNHITSFYHAPGCMLFENEAWFNISKESSALIQNNRMWDNMCVSINPSNKNEIAIGGVSETPLAIIDKNSGLITDTFSTENSSLKRFTNNMVYANSLTYDDEGNLWVSNSYTNSPLHVRQVDGTWSSFFIGANASNKITKDILCDYDGTIWLSVFNTGLFGYDPGGSISSSSDDKLIFLNNGDYSGALPSNNVTAIAVDFDNELWIGTDNGFGILYNPLGAFDAASGEYNVQRPKVEINGEVDYVLGATYINDIEVDGGNRKWFGTANSGMILLSDDGLSVVKHFTTENSPLISNNIMDLEINHNTGEIFIVTDRGLMSYRGDATYEDAEYSDVKVFPNPARPGFDGLITIQGIRYNSDVKITDVAGNLVYKTTSNGGTATWNGKTLNGEDVTSGVYLIWTASNEEKGRFVGKVVVVN